LKNNLAELRRRLIALFHWEQFDADLEEEMQLHQELREQEQVERGVSPEEAHYAVRRRFGNKLVLREESRDMWGWNWLETLLQDIRYGLRQLRRDPGFTAVGVIILALGIGANALIFSVFDALLLRTLPVKDPDRLVCLTVASPRFTSTEFRYIVYERLRERVNCFSALLLQDDVRLAMNGATATVGLSAQMVSENYFEVLGVGAFRGHVFSSHNSVVNGALPVVLGYGFWQRQFGGDPAAVSRVILLRGHPFVIAGVLPRRFRGLEIDSPPDVYIPLAAHRLFSPYRLGDRRNELQFQIIGRPRASVSVAQAQAAFQAFWDRLVGTPRHPGADALAIAKVQSISRGISPLRNRFSLALQLLVGGVSLLLLVVFVNVATLLLTRLATKRKEIAIRMALGGNRRRLLQQLLTQITLLGLLGGAGSLAIAYACRPLLVRLLAPEALVPGSIVLGIRMWAYILGISVLSSIFVGLIYSLKTGRIDLKMLIKDSATTTIGNMRWTVQHFLVMAQLALTVLLLVSAGLLLRSLRNLERVDPGFDYKHVMQFSIDPSLGGYSTAETNSLLNEIKARIESLPSVRNACFALGPLLRGRGFKDTVAPAGQRAMNKEFLNTNVNEVSRGYFETFGIELLAGRVFRQADANSSKPYPAIVNQSFANKFFSHQDPLGKRFGTGLGALAQPEFQVVGVVSDSKYRSLRLPMASTFYSPIWLLPEFKAPLFLYIRTKTNPCSVVAPVRKIVHAAAPDLPLFGIETLGQQVSDSLWREQLMATLSSVFGLLAGLLAAVGLYGVVAYSTKQRTQEVGVRMALGASKSDIVWMILREQALLSSIGLGFGILGSLGVTRILSSLLYHIHATDPLTFAAVALMFTNVALVACYIPARRAAKVDPMVALRYE
jgi:macrolide transport system ATP-binding/permease protein